jgi:hypothetical protein
LISKRKNTRSFEKTICKSFDRILRACVFFLFGGGIYRVGIMVVILRLPKVYVIQPKRHNNIGLMSALSIMIPIAPIFSHIMGEQLCGSANNALLQRKNHHNYCV